jgi:hypothetical protein
MKFLIRLIVGILMLVTAPIWTLISLVAFLGFGCVENPITIVHNFLGIK